VHAGDTLYPQLVIIKLTTQGDTGIVTTRATVHNQRGELVLDGEHTYSLKAASAHEKERVQKHLTGIAYAEVF
jgi:acyl dehydratase